MIARALVVFTFGCALMSCTTSPEPAMELRVLCYNIKHGRGMDGKVDLHRAAGLIRELDPDLVVLQEIDNGAERSGGVDQMAFLSGETGLQSKFGAFMPYQGGQYGIGLMSRFPISDSTNHLLPDGPEPRTALEARVELPNGEELVLCSIHFYGNSQERLAQAQTVVDLYQGTRAPMILAGDFNSTPGSTVMTLIEEHWQNTDKGPDRFTMSSTDPQSEIDFILYRPSNRFEVVDIDVLDEPLISDHRPVFMILRLVPRSES